MKTISKFMLSGKVLFSALVVCFIVLGTSCKKENTDPVKKCDTEGRFTYVEGAGGFYGNYVITLNSGETILPGEVTIIWPLHYRTLLLKLILLMVMKIKYYQVAA
jgi:hypothetical protein